MMKYLILLILFSFALSCSCSKKDVIPRDQMLKITLAKDPEARYVIPGLGQGVKCTEYGPGCVGAHTIALKRLEMIVIEYDSAESAQKDALRLNAYYKSNWLFDDVTKEPVLEQFVIETYGATNPNVTEPKKE